MVPIDLVILTGTLQPGTDGFWSKSDRVLTTHFCMYMSVLWWSDPTSQPRSGGVAGYNQGGGGRKPVAHPTKMYAMPGKRGPWAEGIHVGW